MTKNHNIFFFLIVTTCARYVATTVCNYSHAIDWWRVAATYTTFVMRSHPSSMRHISELLLRPTDSLLSLAMASNATVASMKCGVSNMQPPIKGKNATSYGRIDSQSTLSPSARWPPSWAMQPTIIPLTLLWFISTLLIVVDRRPPNVFA